MQKGVLFNVFIVFMVALSLPSASALVRLYNDDYMLIQPTSAQAGLTIDQDFGAAGLYIDHDGSSGRAIQIENANGEALKISQSGTASALNVIRDVAGTDKLVLLRDSDGTNTQNVLTVQQDGSGYGILIDQNGDGIGLSIDSEATTPTNYALSITSDQGNQVSLIKTNSSDLYQKSAMNTGVGSHWFYRDLSASVTDSPVVRIEQDSTVDDQHALLIQQDGDGMQIALPDAELAECAPSNSGIFANSTGVYTCHDGNYYLLSQ